MPPLISSIILGAIQGLGEFLPISSSGHLILGRYLFNLSLDLTDESSRLAFDVALHLGTLIAVLFYFRDKLFRLFFVRYHPVINHKSHCPLTRFFRKTSEEKKLLLYIIIATIPGALAGFFFDDIVEHALRHPLIVAAMLVFWGLLLAVADRRRQQKEEAGISSLGGKYIIENLSPLKALVVGIFQAFAIIPGTSRSGSTITAGLLLGMPRKNAARFSFMLSVPIIAGAALVKVPLLFNAQLNWSVLAAGLLTSLVVGFLSIKFMLRYLTSHSYQLFVVYRIVLALLIFGIFIVRKGN